MGKRRQCIGKKRDGTRCPLAALKGDTRCFNHSTDPEVVRKRTRHHHTAARKKAAVLSPKVLDVYSPFGLQQLVAETIQGVRAAPGDKKTLAAARVLGRLAHVQSALISEDETKRQLKAILEALHGRREVPLEHYRSGDDTELDET